MTTSEKKKEMKIQYIIALFLFSIYFFFLFPYFIQ